MDYYVNSKTEEETIYEIYKSCRLCGAGAGYKMPIIQNVINLDPDEAELKQKIRECVQIEVHQDDKMPPLICELCVDKVNDFYEFLEMCKQTNKKTRLRLGLPPQTLPRGAPDAGDCILGVTEPVFINQVSNETPKPSRTPKVAKIMMETEPKVSTKFRRKEEPKTPNLVESKKDKPKLTRSTESKKDNSKAKKPVESKSDDQISKVIAESSSLRSGRSRQPSPPRPLRGTKRPSEDSAPLQKLQKTSNPETPSPKSILKKMKVEIPDDLLEPRSKRPRDCTRDNVETPKKEQNKSLKITLTIPKVKSEPKPVAPSPPPSHRCNKCKTNFKTPQALASHMSSHIKVEKVEKPKPLPPKPEPKPKMENCTKCDKSFLSSMFKGHKCVPKRAPECKICKRTFNTTGACTNHEKFCKAAIVATQPAECKTCKRTFANSGACYNHERFCKPPAAATPPAKKPKSFIKKPKSSIEKPKSPVEKRKSSIDKPKSSIEKPKSSIDKPKSSIEKSKSLKKLKIPQWLKSQLLPMEVRLMRCDPLCDDNGRCRDACFVDHDYGLDKKREYPYLYNLSMLQHKLRIKSELAMYDRMVKIQDGITDEFDLDECYTHWDSASDSDSDTDVFKTKSKNDVKRLSTLSLKVLFSPKGLGKVPKKLRKVKSEKPFDSILNSMELDSDKFGISNIINSLEDSINENDNTKDASDKSKKDDDTLFGENKGPGVKNSDFDLLFGNAGSADFNKDKLSSSEDAEKGSPTVDLSYIDKRLSRTDNESEAGDGKGSNLNNSDASKDSDSQNKSGNDFIERKDSNQASVIISPSKNMSKENVTEEKKVAQEVEENGEEKDTLDNENSRSSDTEHRKGSNTNHESEIVDYSNKSDENIKNKDKSAQEDVHMVQNNISTNGDSDTPDKLKMDDLEAASDTDMDDGKLMEAIDAQLGESDNKNTIATHNLSSKIHQESDDFTKDIEF